MLIAFSLCQGSSQTALALVSQSKFHQNSHNNEILHSIIGYGKQKEGIIYKLLYPKFLLYLLKCSAFFLVPVLKTQPWYTHLQKIFSNWQRMPEPFHFAVKALILMRKTMATQKRQYIERIKLLLLSCNFITNRLRSQWLLGQSSKLHRWSCVA